MNVSAKTFKGWIRLENLNRNKSESDGFWITYCHDNVEKHNKGIVDHIKTIIARENLIGGQIEEKFYDTYILYTTADRNEIYKVREILTIELGRKIENLYWVSHIESQEHKNSRGWLLHANNFFNEFNKSIKKQSISRRSDEIKNFEILRLKIYQFMLEEKLMSRNSMVVKPVFSAVDYSINPQLVFVLMPFGEKWSDDVYYLLKEICEKLSLIVMRADDFMMPNNIINDIWKGINEAGIIIADITVHNANVFYELGIAHTIGKDVVLIRGEDGEKSPFDISPWRYVDYSLNPLGAQKFKNTVSQILEEYRKNNFK